jgi:BirA family biotin operon repressor/biotin-[acetyl-CoA-carboxylase] ligase
VLTQYYPHVSSTNQVAKAQLKAGQLTQVTLIWAESQSAGRGTQGRSWVSPPGMGLYLSLALPPTALTSHGLQPSPAPENPTVLTQRLGQAVLNWLKPQLALPQSAWLKPVNDVMVGSGKLAGLLVETLMQPNGQRSGLVVGLGLNIHPLPPALRSQVTRHQPVALVQVLAPGQPLPSMQSLASTLGYVLLEALQAEGLSPSSYKASLTASGSRGETLLN